MLESVLKEKGFEFVAVLENYEEERINEISSIVENKNTIYFYATDVDEKTNIKNFCEKIGMKSLQEVKESILSNKKKEKVIVVISNIERMISKDAKEFVEFIKSFKSENAMFVMISKNTTSTKEVIKTDLSDVITKTIDNESKTIYDILQGKALKPIDIFTYYGVFGSNSRYLKYIDTNKTVKENIINLVLRKDSLFINEAENILKCELRTLQVYNMILTAISKGAKTLSDISEKLELPTSICNKYTTVLINLGILNKIKPVYDNDTRKSEYEISNRLLDFIYNFVFENMGEIYLGKEENVYDEKIMPNMDAYLQNKFAQICREYIVKQIIEQKKGITLKENGKWWDKNNTIDIVMGDNLKAIVANCYWNDEVIGKEKLEELEKAATKIDVADRKYYLFAKKGFSDELRKIVKKRDDVELVDFNTIFEGKKKFFLFK